jgi:hypothetical protein
MQTRRYQRDKFTAVACTLFLVACGVAGCATEQCLPAELEVQLMTSDDQTVLAVTAGGVPCDLGLTEESVYWVSVLSGNTTYPLGRVDPELDGSFNAAFLVPPAAIAGGELHVIGSPFDDCRDLLSDCVGYTAPIPPSR